MSLEENTTEVSPIQKKEKKLSYRKGIVILTVFLLAGIIIGISQCTSAFKEMETRSALTTKKSVFSLLRGDYIGILKIEGTIEKENSEYNQQWLLETIERLINDPQNKALILEINSPGGSVYESDEAYLALRTYAEQKPLYAYCASLAASGGYYIACAADTIFANRNSLTGSIGVISGQSVDITALLEKAGVKITTITAGSNKNMLNINEPLSEEQRAIMQSIANECYEQFVSIVAERRKMDLNEVKSLADGRIYTAKQALNMNLIDGIYDLKEVIPIISSNHDLQNLSVEYFAYEKQKTFLENLLDVSSFIDAARSESSVLLSHLNSQVSFPAFYFKF